MKTPEKKANKAERELQENPGIEKDTLDLIAKFCKFSENTKAFIFSLIEKNKMNQVEKDYREYLKKKRAFVMKSKSLAKKIELLIKKIKDGKNNN